MIFRIESYILSNIFSIPSGQIWWLDIAQLNEIRPQNGLRWCQKNDIDRDRERASRPHFATLSHDERLAYHLDFVSQRIRTNKDFKHRKRCYGFSVTSAQEKDILINELKQVREIKQNQYEVIYADEPQTRYCQNLSHDNPGGFCGIIAKGWSCYPPVVKSRSLKWDISGRIKFDPRLRLRARSLSEVDVFSI